MRRDVDRNSMNFKPIDPGNQNKKRFDPTSLYADDCHPGHIWTLRHYAEEYSDDLHTKVGALIIDNRGAMVIDCNHFPHGVKRTPERLDRPVKYFFMEHAERNVIHKAQRAGLHLEGAVIYLHYGPAPCSDCARAIIQSGIKTVFYPKDSWFPLTEIDEASWSVPWDNSFDYSIAMLAEAGVELRPVDWEVTNS